MSNVCLTFVVLSVKGSSGRCVGSTIPRGSSMMLGFLRVRNTKELVASRASCKVMSLPSRIMLLRGKEGTRTMALARELRRANMIWIQRNTCRYIYDIVRICNNDNKYKRDNMSSTTGDSDDTTYNHNNHNKAWHLWYFGKLCYLPMFSHRGLLNAARLKFPQSFRCHQISPKFRKSWHLRQRGGMEF